MFGILAGPQTKSVVMFRGEDEPLDASGFRRGDDLMCVESGGVENTFRLAPESPFAISERVHGEMEEAIELHFLAAQLALGR